ncbi:MAG: hypothetical protein IKB97_00260 [Bacteroidaceae bacterium]|nr:hypothetical protein [Bacteroidaceae bacterium]MBR3595245.1 hypothetical protein [Candidatus Saccharibacteria bacterium]MBR6122754.1 hypothetical protein [Candidatus Saccharibacteria bacterium]
MDKELRVVIAKDPKGDWMRFEFPDEATDDQSRLLACFHLGKFAEVPERGLFAEGGHHIGYFRDIFYGLTSWRLYEMRIYAGKPPRFVFKEYAEQADDLALQMVLTEIGGQKVEIIIKE